MLCPIRSGHVVSFDDFCILDKVNNNFDLLIHESLLILRDPPDTQSRELFYTVASFLISLDFLILFNFNGFSLFRYHMIVNLIMHSSE